MKIANDGSAIILGHVVRKEGVSILQALATFDTPTYVPVLQRHFGDKYSGSHLYTTLNRLCKLSPALCKREIVEVEVLSTKLRRVSYEVTEKTRAFFR